MVERATTDQALGRLAAALDALDSALARRLENDRRHALLDIQLQAAHDDRARLAAELDSNATRADTLEKVNRDIAHRLDQAMETIRSILKAHGA